VLCEDHAPCHAQRPPDRASGAISLSTHRLRRRTHAPRLSGAGRIHQRVARVVKDEEHRYATTFLVAEKVLQRGNLELTGTTVPAPFLSSSTTPTAWLSTSRKTLRASVASRSIAPASKPRCVISGRRAVPVGKVGKGRSRSVYQQLREKGRTRFLGYDQLDAGFPASSA